ncbi:unnamed protein product [Rhizoctonia solani]|uniref:Amine oxidase domain-containing protein n=1 Tax=Rhizoctonia solani TaxID=456999 RepID=A0A8H3HII0_9AGAM|nr:unnamed protein product [Rhizoctonia solani]
MGESSQRSRIAVVGSGVSGLAATWALNEYSNAEVHLFEADNRPGGHANTVRFKRPGASEGTEGIDVDTFLALPNVNVPVVPTEMTFSVSRDQGNFEWAGKDPTTVFCQIQNLFQPGMWRMVWDILRFNASARRLIEEETRTLSNTKCELSIGDYLKHEGYSNEFIDDYLIPMTAAIWSTPPDTCALDFPARTLIRFMHNHHLLQIIGKPKWLTIPGGSHKYVNRILSKLSKSQLHLSTPVQSISTSPGTSKVQIGLPSGTEDFDHVILATHSDISLHILRQGVEITAEEEKILGSFLWNENRAVLHSDVNKLMPKRRAAWSCWNYLTFSELNVHGEKRANANEVALSAHRTYCMNHLQHINERDHGPVLVTLNPPFEPRPELVVNQSPYEHPVMSAQSIFAQAELHKIQNTRGISYAGAWTKYGELTPHSLYSCDANIHECALGFHEDGFTSGLRAAESIPIPGLTVQLPFSIASPDRAIGSAVTRKLGENLFAMAESVRRMISFVVWWALGVMGAADAPKKKIE